MIDDFFQKKPPAASAHTPNTPKRERHFLFCSLLYTSLAGFVAGSVFGYLHLTGWIPNADEGLILYGVTFSVGAILSTSFALYQSRLNRLKAQKIKD